MDLEKLKKQERKTEKIAIRTYPSYCKFMKDHGLSPNSIFDEALKDLMRKPEKLLGKDEKRN